MDALASYESGSDSDGAGAGARAVRGPDAVPQPAARLPNPFAPEPAASAAGGNKGGEANGAVTGGAAGQKRGAPFVPLTMESRGKAPRMSASQAGRAARPGAPPFRPPQLQGRANVVTEDLDKLFAKRRAAQKRTVEPG